MRKVGRSILGILVGAVVAGIVIAGVEALSSLVYPLSAGVDPHDREALRQVIKALPAGAFLFVLAAWALGALLGAWVAARLAGRSPILHGLGIGLIFLIAGIVNMLMLPHPVWFWVAGIAVLPISSYFGGRWAAISQYEKPLVTR